MTWQKCPVCEGRGGQYNLVGKRYTDCRTCRGHGIISRYTGLPPKSNRVPIVTYNKPMYEEE